MDLLDRHDDDGLPKLDALLDERASVGHPVRAGASVPTPSEITPDR